MALKSLFDQKPSKLELPALGMSETQRFMLLSILIGIFAGLLVVCFHVAIDFIRWYAVGTLAEIKTEWVSLAESPSIDLGVEQVEEEEEEEEETDN